MVVTCTQQFAIQAYVLRNSTILSSGRMADIPQRNSIVPVALPAAANADPDHPGVNRRMLEIRVIDTSSIQCLLDGFALVHQVSEAQCLVGFSGVCCLPGCASWRVVYQLMAFFPRELGCREHHCSGAHEHHMGDPKGKRKAGHF